MNETTLEAQEPTQEEKNWSVINHISGILGLAIIGPLIIYLIKKDESPFISENAKEALNFHITVTIASIISGILSLIVIGIFFLMAIGLGTLVCSILATIKASEGKTYKYPLTMRLIK